MKRRFTFFLALLTLITTPSVGAETLPIRQNLTSCQALLVPGEAVDDSIGIQFSSADSSKFAEELRKQIANHGREIFRNGRFFILGVPEHKKKTVVADYKRIVDTFALAEVNASVQVLTVPSRLIADEAVSLATHVIERLRYFFPSLRLDYQKPLPAEVRAGLLTTAALEVPNVVFLYSALPVVDATLTVTAHAIVLTAYTLYSKSMTNWLLRPGSNNQAINNVEIFIKQTLLSVPFVANFNLFGQFSQIAHYYNTHGWAQTVTAFPNELSSFVVTQGLTLVLQTIFYSQVMSKGFGNWMNGQSDPEKSQLARAARPWLQAPVLMIDAVVLAAASSNWGAPLWTFGPAEFNLGHAALIGLIGAGSGFFKYFPKALDRVLPSFKKLQSWRKKPAIDKSTY